MIPQQYGKMPLKMKLSPVWSDDQVNPFVIL